MSEMPIHPFARLAGETHTAQLQKHHRIISAKAASTYFTYTEQTTRQKQHQRHANTSHHMFSKATMTALPSSPCKTHHQTLHNAIANHLALGRTHAALSENLYILAALQDFYTVLQHYITQSRSAHADLSRSIRETDRLRERVSTSVRRLAQIDAPFRVPFAMVAELNETVAALAATTDRILEMLERLAGPQTQDIMERIRDSLEKLGAWLRSNREKWDGLVAFGGKG